MNDIIAMVESGELENPDIYITPPDGVQTDEDSADEDQGGLIDNLKGQQLQAEAEAVIRTGQYYRRHLEDADSSEDVDDFSDEKPLAKIRCPTAENVNRKVSAVRKCCKDDLPVDTIFGASTPHWVI